MFSRFLLSFSLFVVFSFSLSVVSAHAVGVTELNRDVTSLIRSQGSPRYIVRGTFSAPEQQDGRWVRLEFRRGTEFGKTPFTLEFLDADGMTFASYHSGELAFDSSGRWRSPTIFGSEVKVEIESNSVLPQQTLFAEKIIYWTDPGHGLSVTGKDDRRPAWEFASEPAIQKFINSVAYLNFQGDDGDFYDCTGFLLSGGVMLTNNHCIDTESECVTASILLGYGEAVSNKVEFYECRRVVCTDEHLDYSLLELDRIPGPKWGSLKLGSYDSKMADLLLVQSPDGRPLEVSWVGCAINETATAGQPQLNDYFAHTCDTEGGASGSPVISLGVGSVIGIHQHGFNDQISTLKKYNRAVKVNPIKKHMGQCLSKK